LIEASQNDDERFAWFGKFTEEEKQDTRKKIGRAVSMFERRWLSGIRLLIDTSEANIARRRLRFTKCS